MYTRCKCLPALKGDQCACTVQTQNEVYLKALREVNVQRRETCKGRWCIDKDRYEKWMHLRTHLGTFPTAIACSKLKGRPTSGRSTRVHGTEVGMRILQLRIS